MFGAHGICRRLGAVLVAAAACEAAGALEIAQPLARTAYQTNEPIHLAVVRSGAGALGAGDLVLTVAGLDDGSRMTFTLAVPAVPAAAGARATEHVYLDGRLLRPGRYRVEAAVDGQSATTEIEVYTHLRRTTFRLLNWGRAKGADQLCEGDRALGFNVAYAHYQDDSDANFIRAGMDYMKCCTMSGGHQMDLRIECDWSDPYVLRGGVVRVVRQALFDRTRPNVIGVHFYDEPGLTWWKHAVTGEMTAHDVPAQVRSFESAFGTKYLPHNEVDPANPDHVARWRDWARWKLGFMDAAWKAARWGVGYVRPDYLSVTQSQYGFTAFTDGYYFNVVRSLPVTSGHGGYHDWGPGYFNPSWTLEVARARDIAKPCWYLPTWYGDTSSELYRLEQYLSFQTNIQGMMCPPDIDPFKPETKPAAAGLVESNMLMARLGTIFTTMPVTRPPVAMLYSLSHEIAAQTRDMKIMYAHGEAHARNLVFTYLAGKLLQRQFMPVLDEDIIDGTLAAHHRAVILTSISHLDPEVASGLEAFARDGGLVLMTADCGVEVAGAVKLDVTPALPNPKRIAELEAALKREGLGEDEKKRLGGELRKFTATRGQLAAARLLADAVEPELQGAGIAPVFESDEPGIVATRQAAGDIEYLFAVNAAHDAAGDALLGVRAADAMIRLPADGRPVYDAVVGGRAREFHERGGSLEGRFRFGPGEMRVFARTAAPIGGAKAAKPVVRRDYTVGQNTDNAPLTVEVGAALLDERGILLSGSAPLRVRVVDPLGATRHDLLRATRLGTFTMRLPLAVNDPPGDWTVLVTELLSGTEDKVTFRLESPARAAAVAGRKLRAVHFGRDRDNVFRFFRVHRDVTVVKGASDLDAAAAERLARVLGPWDVKCRVVDAAEVNRPRELSADEAATWVGLEFGRAAAGRANSPAKVGFDVRGPVVLVGSPDDNPLIAHLAKQGYLPYAPKRDEFPGRARGFIAWQRDGVGHGQESATVIAYDEAGMTEAVGSLYEAMAGMEPLTPLELPKASEVAPASRADVPAGLGIAWERTLDDCAVLMETAGESVLVTTRDGSRAKVDARGRVSARETLGPAAYARALEAAGAAADAAALEVARKAARPGELVKRAARRGNAVAAGHWGGLVRIVDGAGKIVAERRFLDDVTGVAWLGEVIVVGLSDGRVVGLKAPGAGR